MTPAQAASVTITLDPADAVPEITETNNELTLHLQ